ncbi:conjugal transfer protein [Streptomonospora litoralis]|uniref:TcpE family protein n=1 Tax=Streptomonospora litoralis TaxID=2498135 RepID=A0A4P6PWS8_9ACTN|nr:conjugal transfer protein [Streptomonospora litoralis]QBI52533.1 TcpE family protein [Streptomonospora litoralis]
MDLPTYTNIWRIEKKLYKLYDFRLPQPVSVVYIGVVVGVGFVWVMLLRLLGVPLQMPLHVVYIVPPFVIAFLATRPVVEGKRLSELIVSQVRFLAEPRVYTRLRPEHERGAVEVTVRVWHRHPQAGPLPQISGDAVEHEHEHERARRPERGEAPQHRRELEPRRTAEQAPSLAEALPAAPERLPDAGEREPEPLWDTGASALGAAPAAQEHAAHHGYSEDARGPVGEPQERVRPLRESDTAAEGGRRPERDKRPEPPPPAADSADEVGAEPDPAMEADEWVRPFRASEADAVAENGRRAESDMEPEAPSPSPEGGDPWAAESAQPSGTGREPAEAHAAARPEPPTEAEPPDLRREWEWDYGRDRDVPRRGVGLKILNYFGFALDKAPQHQEPPEQREPEPEPGGRSRSARYRGPDSGPIPGAARTPGQLADRLAAAEVEAGGAPGPDDADVRPREVAQAAPPAAEQSPLRHGEPQRAAAEPASAEPPFAAGATARSRAEEMMSAPLPAQAQPRSHALPEEEPAPAEPREEPAAPASAPQQKDAAPPEPTGPTGSGGGAQRRLRGRVQGRQVARRLERERSVEDVPDEATESAAPGAGTGDPDRVRERARAPQPPEPAHGSGRPTGRPSLRERRAQRRPHAAPWDLPTPLDRAESAESGSGAERSGAAAPGVESMPAHGHGTVRPTDPEAAPEPPAPDSRSTEAPSDGPWAADKPELQLDHGTGEHESMSDAARAARPPMGGDVGSAPRDHAEEARPAAADACFAGEDAQRRTGEAARGEGAEQLPESASRTSAESEHGAGKPPLQLDHGTGEHESMSEVVRVFSAPPGSRTERTGHRESADAAPGAAAPVDGAAQGTPAPAPAGPGAPEDSVDGAATAADDRSAQDRTPADAASAPADQADAAASPASAAPVPAESAADGGAETAPGDHDDQDRRPEPGGGTVGGAAHEAAAANAAEPAQEREDGQAGQQSAPEREDARRGPDDRLAVLDKYLSHADTPPPPQPRFAEAGGEAPRRPVAWFTDTPAADGSADASGGDSREPQRSEGDEDRGRRRDDSDGEHGAAAVSSRGQQPAETALWPGRHDSFAPQPPRDKGAAAEHGGKPPAGGAESDAVPGGDGHTAAAETGRTDGARASDAPRGPAAHVRTDESATPRSEGSDAASFDADRPPEAESPRRGAAPAEESHERAESDASQVQPASAVDAAGTGTDGRPGPVEEARGGAAAPSGGAGVRAAGDAASAAEVGADSGAEGIGDGAAAGVPSTDAAGERADQGAAVFAVDAADTGMGSGPGAVEEGRGAVGDRAAGEAAPPTDAGAGSGDDGTRGDAAAAVPEFGQEAPAEAARADLAPSLVVPGKPPLELDHGTGEHESFGHVDAPARRTSAADLEAAEAAAIRARRNRISGAAAAVETDHGAGPGSAQAAGAAEDEPADSGAEAAGTAEDADRSDDHSDRLSRTIRANPGAPQEPAVAPWAEGGADAPAVGSLGPAAADHAEYHADTPADERSAPSAPAADIDDGVFARVAQNARRISHLFGQTPPGTPPENAPRDGGTEEGDVPAAPPAPQAGGHPVQRHEPSPHGEAAAAEPAADTEKPELQLDHGTGEQQGLGGPSGSAPAQREGRPASPASAAQATESGGTRGWRRLARVVTGGSPAAAKTDLPAGDIERLRTPLQSPRNVVVLGCTGGAGQTVTTLMLGHTLAAHRDERVVAVDVNPGGGGLSRRIRTETPETLTSLLANADAVHSYAGLRRYTSRTPTGLEVVATLDDPYVQTLDDRDYAGLAGLLERHYEVTVLDPAATGVARALPVADGMVLVAPASEDAARAVAMTFEWLDGHGYAALRSTAVVVINGVSKRSLADVDAAEQVARGRCRAIVRVPWDDHLAAGKSVDVAALRSTTRRAHAALGGVLMHGLDASAPAQAPAPGQGRSREPEARR